MTDGGTRVYSGLTPTERDDARAGRLHAAALELFGTAGYAPTSVERICTEAKVSTRSFYQLYPNKEALLLDVHGALISDAVASAVAAFDRHPGPSVAHRAAAGLVAYVDPMVSDRRLARLAFVEVVGVSAQMEQHRATLRDHVVELLVDQAATARGRGELVPPEVRVATIGVIGAATAVVHDWVISDRPSPRDELERHLSAIAVALLGPARL